MTRAAQAIQSSIQVHERALGKKTSGVPNWRGGGEGDILPGDILQLLQGCPNKCLTAPPPPPHVPPPGYAPDAHTTCIPWWLSSNIEMSSSVCCRVKCLFQWLRSWRSPTRKRMPQLIFSPFFPLTRVSLSSTLNQFCQMTKMEQKQTKYTNKQKLRC